MIHLARIFGDGCVLQRDKKVRIWGWCDQPCTVTVKLTEKADRENVTARASAMAERVSEEGTVQIVSGRWYEKTLSYRFDIRLDPMKAGGPYELEVSDEREHVIVHDVYVGEVLHLCGQSNIEFPMTRVKDTYPEEFEAPDEPMIRTFKVQQKLVFTGPLPDAQTGEWESVTAKSLPEFSALGYFAAKRIREQENVAVGLVNTTLGGSYIESWMSREMLGAWPDLVRKLDECKGSMCVENNFHEGIRVAEDWGAKLNHRDSGVVASKVDSVDFTTRMMAKFALEDQDTSDWESIRLPAMFSAVEQLRGFSGSVWLKKKFNVPKEIAGKACMLWLGTMTDADETYVNGQQVGVTYYKYPPRRYPIAAGILHEGENDVTIRLKVEKGHGRVTPGKLLAVFEGEGRRTTDGFNEGIEGVNWLADLSGEWKMKKGCEMPEKGDVEFIIQRPAGQFNGMLSPVWNYTSGEVVWYQGESDSDRAHLYMDKFRAFTRSWRQEIQDPTLPFYVVVLPEYDEMNYEKDENPETVDDWGKIQAVQRQTVDNPYTYPVEITGSGELNDLHPQRKKIVGERVAEAILSHMRK